MKTCGGCFHYKSGICKNRDASTYKCGFPSNSHGCDMYFTNFFKPVGWGFNIIGVFILIMSLFTQAFGGSSGGSGNSNNSGFEL